MEFVFLKQKALY